MITIDTTNMCSHLQRKLFEEDGVYHRLWLAMQDDPELTAVVRSRQLHIYRNGKKVLVLAGKAVPKAISMAVNARRPKTRYLIGFMAKPMVWMHTILPTRWFDYIVKHAS